MKLTKEQQKELSMKKRENQKQKRDMCMYSENLLKELTSKNREF